jgi:hypothetical protein
MDGSDRPYARPSTQFRECSAVQYLESEDFNTIKKIGINVAALVAVAFVLIAASVLLT